MAAISAVSAPRTVASDSDLWANRLGADAALPSLIKFVAVGVCVALMSHYGLEPVHEHRQMLALWTGIGMLSALSVLVHIRVATRSQALEVAMLAFIAGSDFAAVVAIMALTGGATGPFWAITFVNTTAAAVIAPTRSVAFAAAFGYVGALIGATALAHDLNRATAGHLVVISVALPLIALLGNEVQLVFATAGGVMTHIKDGKLKALGVTSAQPFSFIPGLPTIASQGVKDYDVDTIGFLVAPLKTPAAVVKRLNQAIVQIMQQPDVKERLAGGGSEAVSSTPEQLQAKLAADDAMLRRLFKQIGVSPAK